MRLGIWWAIMSFSPLLFIHNPDNNHSRILHGAHMTCHTGIPVSNFLFFSLHLYLFRLFIFLLFLFSHKQERRREDKGGKKKKEKSQHPCDMPRERHIGS